ncbi:hypothetical protein BpHYR1_043497 [Brachionus plicatilis]|uniref:Uncharacterized protein n=1 Tax=Brachionus plicatilis TaxID=10195 RepID=A0A3M7PQZ8_BRAPC|nr:hypothetical protein BpHYR1_043497 [Brachionus plicatilis]
MDKKFFFHKLGSFDMGLYKKIYDLFFFSLKNIKIIDYLLLSLKNNSQEIIKNSFRNFSKKIPVFLKNYVIKIVRKRGILKIKINPLKIIKSFFEIIFEGRRDCFKIKT